MNGVAAVRIEIYEFGNFRLDTGKRVLLDRRGTLLALTPKVYDTLAYLVQHAGTVHVGGIDVVRSPQHARGLIGLAPQETGV